MVLLLVLREEHCAKQAVGKLKAKILCSQYLPHGNSLFPAVEWHYHTIYSSEERAGFQCLT